MKALKCKPSAAAQFNYVTVVYAEVGDRKDDCILDLTT